VSDNSTVHRDAFWLLCDQRIGSGMSRAVYTSPLFPDAVIKVEDGAGRFQNVMEWELWQLVSGQEAEKWFAPCLHISPCGTILVMARTYQPEPSQYPDRMPVFLADFKRKNYGMYNGRLVCHDYGTCLAMQEGFITKAMRKVAWYN
jgi:hypothetical protein